MSTIDSCARSLFARVLNSSVVYVFIGGFLRYTPRCASAVGTLVVDKAGG